MQQRQFVQKIKVDFIVIGNQNSGKTSLIKRFVLGQNSFSHYYTPTVGLNLQKKIIKQGNKQITVCIWDTAGQQKFFALTKNYFKKADGVLIIFDITDRVTFQRIEKYWMDQIKDKSDQECVKILIGNKIDLSEERQVKHSQAKQLSEKYKIEYFETSAKTGQDVQEAFRYLAKKCGQKIHDVAPVKIITISPPSEQIQKPKASGCFNNIRNLFNKYTDK